MTEPTQAQIEAAAKAIGDLEPFEVYDCEKAAQAALTAAAGVVTGKSGYEYISTHDEVVAAEREACAQVADSFRYGGYEQIADAIAAAIRARKDKS